MKIKELTTEQETVAMMRITELLQANVAAEEPASDRQLLCSVYVMGKEDGSDEANDDNMRLR